MLAGMRDRLGVTGLLVVVGCSSSSSSSSSDGAATKEEFKTDVTYVSRARCYPCSQILPKEVITMARNG